ncbi:unnamed protein product [Nezara viridula]|uniref:C2H2-type domain-containing protein n=1 Tax=Nezara viridula TaxID=85310 RepID=A0A9P0HAI3_NEZVI|nr:unnamed protein product [Nezara viridula]
MKLFLVFLVLLKIINCRIGEDVRTGFFTGNGERNAFFIRAFRKPSTLVGQEDYVPGEEIFTIKINDADTEEAVNSTESSTLKTSKATSTKDLKNHQEKSLKKSRLFEKAFHDSGSCKTIGEAFICPYCNIEFLVNLTFEKHDFLPIHLKSPK